MVSEMEQEAQTHLWELGATGGILKILAPGFPGSLVGAWGKVGVGAELQPLRSPEPGPQPALPNPHAGISFHHTCRWRR